jgi:N-methylhydantoinase A/oxoprolinase/acetone carboxylase beta subunit
MRFSAPRVTGLSPRSTHEAFDRLQSSPAASYIDFRYDRYSLGPDAQLEGPAIIEDHESTAVVPPGARAIVDQFSSLVIQLDDVAL